MFQSILGMHPHQELTEADKDLIKSHYIFKISETYANISIDERDSYAALIRHIEEDLLLVNNQISREILSNQLIKYKEYFGNRYTRIQSEQSTDYRNFDLTRINLTDDEIENPEKFISDICDFMINVVNNSSKK